ncbi:MAG: hypothetical protein V1646_03145 [bacterium]
MVKKVLFLNKFIILGVFTFGIFASVFSMETDSDQERRLRAARSKEDSSKKAKASPEKPSVTVSPGKRLLPTDHIAPFAPESVQVESEIYDPEAAASVAGNFAFGAGEIPTKKRKDFSLDAPILPDVQVSAAAAGVASVLDFHGFKEKAGSALSTPQYAPNRSPEKVNRTPGGDSPMRTPKRQGAITTSPVTPGFRKIDISEYLIPKDVFVKFMDYFIKNICELGDESDLFVSSIKNIKFEVIFSGIDRSKLRGSGYLANYLLPHIYSVIPNVDNDHVINLIRFYYYLKIRESLKNEFSRHKGDAPCRRKINFEEASEAFPMDVSYAAAPSFSDDESDDTGGVQVTFGDDYEDASSTVDSDFYCEFNKQLSEENGATLLFDIIEKSKYRIYLLGASIEYFQRDFVLAFPWLSFIHENIVHENQANFHFLYKILGNHLFELSVETSQVIYDSIIALIGKNIKEGSLLSYDFKYMLLSAKKIEGLFNIKRSRLNLDSIVLFRDDHILNLIYEGRRSDKSACRLAGGHFPAGVGCSVINRDPSEQGRNMRVCHVTDLAACSDCGVSYKRFDAQWSTSAVASASSVCSASSSQCSKESTTFPDSIRQNFHKYVKWMFDFVARPSECASDPVTLLSRAFQPSQAKTVCLFRHKATCFNKFSQPTSVQVSPSHDHDIYVFMVIFNEDDIDVIWTCYLLGVFIVDWSAEIEHAISDHSSTNIQICGVQFEKTFVGHKIFEVYKDIESKRNRAARVKFERPRVAPSGCGRVKQKHKSKSKAPSARAASSLSMSSLPASEDVSTYSFVESDGNPYNLIGLGNGVYLKIRNDDFERIGRVYRGLPNVQTKPE